MSTLSTYSIYFIDTITLYENEDGDISFDGTEMEYLLKPEIKISPLDEVDLYDDESAFEIELSFEAISDRAAVMVAEEVLHAYGFGHIDEYFVADQQNLVVTLQNCGEEVTELNTDECPCNEFEDICVGVCPTHQLD